MPIRVVLDDEQMVWTEEVGRQRAKDVEGGKARESFKYQTGRGSDYQHILGCRGELAVTIGIPNLPKWAGKSKEWNKPDVGPRLQVRTSPNPMQVKVRPIEGTLSPDSGKPQRYDDPEWDVIQVVSFPKEPNILLINGFVNAGWSQIACDLVNPQGAHGKTCEGSSCQSGDHRDAWVHMVHVRDVFKIRPGFHVTCTLDGHRCQFCGKSVGPSDVATAEPLPEIVLGEVEGYDQAFDEVRKAIAAGSLDGLAPFAVISGEMVVDARLFAMSLVSSAGQTSSIVSQSARRRLVLLAEVLRSNP